MFNRKKKDDVIDVKPVDPIQCEIDRLITYLGELDPRDEDYATVVHDIEVLTRAKALRDNDMSERQRQDTIRYIKSALANAGGIIMGGVIKYIITEVLIKRVVFK